MRMFISFYRMLTLCLVMVVSGCATNNNLYNWGSYEKNTYKYFQAESGDSAIGDLEAQANTTLAGNEQRRLPPGFWAHLGLLYSGTGQYDKAAEMFVREKTSYPESTKYMNFLLERQKK